MEPLDACSPDCEALELDVDELEDVDELADDVVAVVAPGTVWAPTAANTPSAPTPATATPAVRWLIRLVARSRAWILLWTLCVVRMGPCCVAALGRLWEFPEKFL